MFNMGSQGPEPLHYGREPIAIVGSSCRLPGGATSPAKLWDLLQNPRDVVQEIPASRFNTKAFYHPDSQHHGSANVKHAYLLDEDPRFFDREFFAINPKEAESLDPQQRQLLETVYEGIDTAGYSIDELRGSSTAVFVGCMSVDYQYVAIRGIDTLPQYHATGTAMSMLANRVSYFFDWRGPSAAIDTACSSSLVALHMAVSALRNGDAKMAIAAGSNLILGPETFIAESKLNMLSPNGSSYMWDSAANGYTRGEGFSVVVLKTLSRALADGDHIESIIRETGVGSDGKTPGITMPSSDAQAQLIRDTYARCGLDPTLESDRPQFFEAHGTGTPTGDPIEARAIHSVFFPEGADTDNKLLVGSIKTIIGHTEGTAGLAGVLKASLAVQNGQVPGNLHFNELNPRIRPYYHNLHVPTKTLPWPDLPIGAARRVSVNSFGFGGTNAHAIIESYDSHLNSLQKNSSSLPCAGPFVISANSGQALAKTAAELAKYLREKPDTNLGGLAYTLFQRTGFPFRAAFSGSTSEMLAGKLETNNLLLEKSSRTASISEKLPPRILGIFTGQGAQFATMGCELYESSNVFRKAFIQMQYSLDSLPPSDRPDWTLIDQLRMPAQTSRVGEAVISQPLCTALQVALVDVLHAAGIRFGAVVGHSSGEIAAAYAAGYLDASNAIRIAYYRGFHSHLAQGPTGSRGKMIAVAMPLEEATEFCSEFDGALTLAASNSQSSCTLSGDAEAIEAAKFQLDRNGTFARVLAVDTAYHSRHMEPCAGPYLKSLEKCGTQVKPGSKDCTWYSSVWGSDGRSRSFDNADNKLLGGQYWIDNLTKPVLFSQALARAVNEDQCFDLALEVGPHPALKGPSSETIKTLTNLSLPYSGVLRRGQSSMEAFADALGLIWKAFPSSQPIITIGGIFEAFQMPGVDKKVSKQIVHPQIEVLKGLPTYPWDHTTLLWKESRASRTFRTQNQPRHELLGHSVTHGEQSRREVHWKQVFRLSELPWLRGHMIQGQILFPASGYLSMSYEAALQLVVDQQSIRLVEMHDIDIVRVMSLDEDSAGLEVLFTVRVTSQSETCITAEVTCYSGAVDAVQPLDSPQAGLITHFSGGLKVWLGQSDENALPPRVAPLLPMDTLDMDQLYSNLGKEGFSYSELFQAKSINRRLNHAVVTVSTPPEASSIQNCMHPVSIETGMQGLLAAYSFPGDGRIRTTYLPTRIDSIRISMVELESEASVLTADSIITSSDAASMTGNVTLFNAMTSSTAVQIHGVHLTAVGSQEDRWLYASETWVRNADYGIEHSEEIRLSSEDLVLYEQLVRTAYFYLRQLRSKIRPAELKLMSKFRRHMMRWVIEHLFPQIEAGENPDIRPEWKNDTLAMVQQWRESQSSDNNDMNLLHAMGKSLVSIVRGTVPPLRVLVKDGMLDRLYVEGLGFKDANASLGSLIKQLGHQHPRMRILEIGAGTGGTTRAVLSALGSQYTAYSYTDVSTGFFENARNVFSQYASRLTFKTLNIEKDPIDQGYIEGSYDMVLSSNCLHTTKSLESTLRHCRKLLRPGGRLVLVEITRDFLPIQLVMATLPGWFLGMDEGRVWAPTISLERWDELLKATGFSGVDISLTPSYCSVIMSQAVDREIQILREPLAVGPEMLPPLSEFLVVGGTESKLPKQMQAILEMVIPGTVVVLPSLEGIQVPRGATVLCLSDLDGPIFGNMNEKRFGGLQAVMQSADVVLWVTNGAKSGGNPEANIMVGMGSTLLAERNDLQLQFLDVDDPTSIDPTLLAKLLLRLALKSPAKSDELLWTQEPKLSLKDGALYIPRVLSLDIVNRRSAARHRQVSQITSLGSPDTVVVFAEHNDAFEFQSRPIENAEEKKMRVQVIASSISTLSYGKGKRAHLCIGRDLASQEKVLVLSDESRSQISVDKDHVVHSWCDSDTNIKDSTRLKLLLEQILAKTLLQGLESPAWIHGASQDLSEAIRIAADEQTFVVFQTTSDMARAAEINFIHPYATDQNLRGIKPKNLKSFLSLDFSTNGALSTFMRAHLPAYSIMEKRIEDCNLSLSLSELRSLARQSIFDQPENEEEQSEIIAINKVSSDSIKSLSPMAVIDWCAAETVTTTTRPTQHRGMFAADKTYILFGMTGDLGISVCQWMVANGARHVVLTSRNPDIQASVLDFMSLQGANVRTMAVDITKRDSLLAASKEIKSSMPSVGGIMNAAMVLRDHLFHDMSWDDFAAVLAPKVQGTRNIDEIFGDEESSLDFFICFSSATSIIGTVGQSAYAAANHFMASFVQQRCQRGLPGSIVHISVLTGLGYIYRRDSSHTTAIDKALLPRLVRQAETDLHDMLAEAIVCGRPDSGQPIELITGIRTVFRGNWRDDPRLSCYLGEQQLQDDSSQQRGSGTIGVEVQLAAAEEPSECLAILEKCFKHALGNMLEIDPEQVDSSMPVANLGIDSLVAIRIREWFLKEVKIEVPVLKVMSVSYSLSRMCEDVLVGWRKLKREDVAV